MGNCNTFNELDDYERNRRNVNYHLGEYKKLLSSINNVVEDDVDNLKRIPALKQKILNEIEAMNTALERDNSAGKATSEEKNKKENEIAVFKKKVEDLEPELQTVLKDNIAKDIENHENEAQVQS